MFEELELPDIDETIKNEIKSDVLEYTDRRRRNGVEALLDKKQTILAMLKRKRTSNKKNTLIPDDLRYRTWNVATEKHSNAVVFLMLDKSGSMAEDKIYTVKALYFWIVQFLRRRYDKVDIRFIAHDYEARELSEKEFFTISYSGGTKISSAYELCKNLIKHNYPTSLWNVYCFHSSDGDSYDDEDLCMQLIGELFSSGIKLFAYTEIAFDDNARSELFHRIKKSRRHRRLLHSVISRREDIIDTLKKFLHHSLNVPMQSSVALQQPSNIL